MAIGAEGNVKWVDGLRGIASTLVVFTHIARSFDLSLFSPAPGEGEDPYFLQWPYLRVFVQGRIGVSIFALVTGYVCALKPIKLSKQGNQEAAFASMAKSALRRAPRLILPTVLITCILWVLTQFGAFQTAKHSDSWWVGFTSPEVYPTWGEAIYDLFHNLISTWTFGSSSYDGNQWTMLPLLRGSMQVYVFMLATAHVKQRYRMMLSLLLYLYFWMGKDAGLGMQFFWGVFMADLQNHDQANAFIASRTILRRVFAGTFLFVGLTWASFPEAHFEWAAWSSAQFEILKLIVPENADYPRYGSGIGLELITLGLHLSPTMRDILANRVFLWFGRQSFAVYLLHGPLLRTVLCWILYGFAVPDQVLNEEGVWVTPPIKFPGLTKLFLALPFWLPLNYACAVLWTTYVDPYCASLTERFVGYILEDKTEKTMLLPLQMS